MRQIPRIIQKLERLAERVIVQLTVNTTANLVKTTPVDTGWAQSNWIPSIGVALLKNLSNVDPTRALALGAKQRQQSAITNTVSNYRLNKGAVFITNNVPYITDLNNGSSKKAPAAFVQQAIAKAVTKDLNIGSLL